MWEHEEGQKLLRALLDLGLCLHNIGSRSKDAIKVFQETIEMDPDDHLVSCRLSYRVLLLLSSPTSLSLQSCIHFLFSAHQLVRHRLLRCYLDSGDGLKARELLDIMTTGSSLTAIVPAPKEKALRLKKIKLKHSKEEAEPSAAPVTAVASSSNLPVAEVKDKRSCCIYNRAFIEHISLMLEEPGASEEERDRLLGEGIYFTVKMQTYVELCASSGGLID